MAGKYKIQLPETATPAKKVERKPHDGALPMDPKDNPVRDGKKPFKGLKDGR